MAELISAKLVLRAASSGFFGVCLLIEAAVGAEDAIGSVMMVKRKRRKKIAGKRALKGPASPACQHQTSRKLRGQVIGPHFIFRVGFFPFFGPIQSPLIFPEPTTIDKPKEKIMGSDNRTSFPTG
jgi:hypothetical protein